MKYWKRTALGFGALLLIVAVLLWFLPARWVLSWVEPRLHGLRLHQVQGLLWEGRAGQLQAADGRLLGQLQWRLSRRALLGQVQLQLDFHGPQLDFSGQLQQLPAGRAQWRDVSLRAELAALVPLAKSPLGQPRGELLLTVEHAVLQAGWPLQLEATAQWQHAVMRTAAGDVALGNLQWQAQAQSGVVNAQVHDDEHGPLQVDGQLTLSPLGWRLDATLRARQTEPLLQHWLAGLGSVDASGTVHVQRNGGLAASLPPPKREIEQP